MKTGEFAGVTQLVECHLAKVDVDGSSPFARSKGRNVGSNPTRPERAGRLGGLGHFQFSDGCVAQMVEQLTLNQWVAGSIPATPTTVEDQFAESVQS